TRDQARSRGSASGSFALEAADPKRKVRAFGRRGGLNILDIALGVAVDDRQPPGGGVLGHELAVLPPERFAKADWGMATEVRQPFPFLFAHLVVVGRPGAA